METGHSHQQDSGGSLHQELVRLTMGVAQTQAVAMAAQLKLADLMSDTPMAAEELAKETNTQPENLGRLLKALAHVGVIDEGQPGLYTLTPLGAQLRSDAADGLHHFAMLMGADHFARVWPCLSETVRSGSDPFREVWGKSFYEYLPGNPAAAGVFMNAMVELSVTQGIAMQQAYDFTPYRNIVDVGGGVGGFLATLLPQLPEARGVLQDLPPVIEQARTMAQDGPMVERCTFVPGDFLESVPEGGDLYVIKAVMMDRSDDEAVKILKNVRKAMAPHGKVLVADPDVAAIAGPFVDLLMLLMTSGRLRTDSEFRQVFEDAGFELTLSEPTDSTIRVWEGSPVPVG